MYIEYCINDSQTHFKRGRNEQSKHAKVFCESTQPSEFFKGVLSFPTRGPTFSSISWTALVNLA